MYYCGLPQVKDQRILINHPQGKQVWRKLRCTPALREQHLCRTGISAGSIGRDLRASGTTLGAFAYFPSLFSLGDWPWLRQCAVQYMGRVLISYSAYSFRETSSRIHDFSPFSSPCSTSTASTRAFPLDRGGHMRASNRSSSVCSVAEAILE